MGAMCPKCASPVALHEGKPNVTAGGVELWHATCWAVRHARPVEQVAIVAPRSRLSSAIDWWSNAAAPRVIDAGRWRYLAGGVAAVLALVVAVKPAHPMPASAPALSLADEDDDEAVRPAYHTTSRVDAPPQIKEPVYTVPVVEGVALDEQFPSLLDWIHPVTGATEKVPEQATLPRKLSFPSCGSTSHPTSNRAPRGSQSRAKIKSSLTTLWKSGQ